MSINEMQQYAQETAFNVLLTDFDSMSLSTFSGFIGERINRGMSMIHESEENESTGYNVEY